MKICLYKCIFLPFPPTHLTFYKNIGTVTWDGRFYTTGMLNTTGHIKSCCSNEDGAAKVTTEQLVK